MQAEVGVGGTRRCQRRVGELAHSGSNEGGAVRAARKRLIAAMVAGGTTAAMVLAPVTGAQAAATTLTINVGSGGTVHGAVAAPQFAALGKSTFLLNSKAGCGSSASLWITA